MSLLIAIFHLFITSYDKGITPFLSTILFIGNDLLILPFLIIPCVTTVLDIELLSGLAVLFEEYTSHAKFNWPFGIGIN